MQIWVFSRVNKVVLKEVLWYTTQGIFERGISIICKRETGRGLIWASAPATKAKPSRTSAGGSRIGQPGRLCRPRSTRRPRNEDRGTRRPRHTKARAYRAPRIAMSAHIDAKLNGAVRREFDMLAVRCSARPGAFAGARTSTPRRRPVAAAWRHPWRLRGLSEKGSSSAWHAPAQARGVRVRHHRQHPHHRGSGGPEPR